MNSSKLLQPQALRRWGLVCLFLLAFLPRAVYPVSRPLQWYLRSSEFIQAVLQGEWAGTLLAEHPGVTVMWLAGAALWGWYGLQSLVGVMAPPPLEMEGYAFADRVAVGLLPLALLISLGIIWGWLLLRRIFGEQVAWVGAVMWAIDPFYLANSKALHLDATLSTLMVLSALWMLIYVQERRRRQLLTSAILGGLAILTKITAVFLIPFFGLVLLVHARPTHGAVPDARSWPSSLVARSVVPLIVWMTVAIVCFVALWPALWVLPGESFDLMIRTGILSKIDQTHRLPRFHRGEVFIGDPGTGYYLDTVLFRLTFLTLPLGAVGLGAAVRQRGKTPTLLLVAFFGFYFIQMTLAGRKEGRYMLPVILAVDILAAQGLVWWVERVSTKRAVQVSLAGGLLALQCVAVLARHPYYGTHYNLLMGGPKAASGVFALAEWGEGLDLAGQYVDQQLGSENGTVGTQFLANEMVAQHVRAEVREITNVEDAADYLVFGVQYTARGSAYERWGKSWQQVYRFREPLFVATFDGLPYAWVYQPGSDPVVPQRIEARFGQATRLIGYRIDKSEVAPGETLLLTLHWQADAPLESTYHAFVHLEGPSGQLIAQDDGPLEQGGQPADSAETGGPIENRHELLLPADSDYGDYTLWTGLYDPMTMTRLPAYDAVGSPLPDDRLTLADVQVRPRVPAWWWPFSAAWWAIIAVGAAWPPLTSRARRQR